MDGDGEKEIEASQRESVGHFQSAERLVSLNFYCKVHYIMCIKICRWNIFGGVPALLATIYMYIYIYIYAYIYIIIIYLYNTSTHAEMYERGVPPPQSGGITCMHTYTHAQTCMHAYRQTDRHTYVHTHGHSVSLRPTFLLASDYVGDIWLQSQ